MTRVDQSKWALTPSQQKQHEVIHTTLTSIHGRHRPFLLTGDVGVGKTFLARRLVVEPIVYYNIAQNHLPQLLTHRKLSDLTPEAAVRFVKKLIKEDEAPYVIADGFEPLLSMWAVEHPKVLPNFFVALGRTILDQPLLVVVQTSSDHLPYDAFRKGELWPSERRFRLELTLADKEVVARNWGVDPMRGRVSTNLYELLAAKLER
jgi:hypothetical protein